MYLIIDNYDSFTFNLYQAVGCFVSKIEVYRNDEITVDEVCNMSPDAVIISPGPGRPENSGITLDLVKALSRTTPMLGVCLGFQAIGITFGGRLVHSPEPVHGQSTPVLHRNSGLFQQLENPLLVGRYHSLMLDPKTIPSCLEVDGCTMDGLVMAVHHNEFPIYGVQFHPESILTPKGEKILKNFIHIASLYKEVRSAQFVHK